MFRMSFYCIHFLKFTQCLYCMFYLLQRPSMLGLNAMSFFFFFVFVEITGVDVSLLNGGSIFDHRI